MADFSTASEQVQKIGEYFATQKCSHGKETSADCPVCIITIMHGLTEEMRAEQTQAVQHLRGLVETSARSLGVAIEVAVRLTDEWPYECQFCPHDHESLATHIEEYKSRDGSLRTRFACDEHAERFLGAPAKEHEVEYADILRKAVALKKEVEQRMLRSIQAEEQDG